MKKKIFLFFFFIFFNFKVFSIEVKTLATINNSIITNLDLEIDIIIVELLTGTKIKANQLSFFLNQAIDIKIKKKEVENKEIYYDKNILEKEFKNQISKIDFQKLTNKQSYYTEKIKKRIRDNILVQYKWNRLISLLYSDKITINTNEINKIVNSKNYNEDQKKKMIEIEKNKKINIFEKMHFNQIKNKYYIKKVL